MNATIINEIDTKAISNIKNKIYQNKILIDNLDKKISEESTTFDDATEICSKIEDCQLKIQELEKKALQITFKHF